MDDIAARAGAAGLFLAIVVAGYLVYRLLLARARLRAQALFKAYFQGQVTAQEMGERARRLPGHRLLPSSELLALATAAFHGAVNEKLQRKPPLSEDTDRLMRTLAALKLELGLPDLYRVEGWRAGRE
ncbi:MAG: hypothetical protein JO288_14315 [Hyphomicrobiales bacterium]|nr:hypothetical protein [Hyphomicrobiales bacterium]